MYTSMERNSIDNTRPNGRLTAPLVINSPSQRRGLFSGPRTQDGDAVESVARPARPRTSGFTSLDAKSASPSSTRIPRLSHQRSSQPRPKFTLSDAYKMAEEEEEAAAEGSPSPAPRSWRARTESVGGRSQKPATRPSTDSPLRTRRRLTPKPAEDDTISSVDSMGAQSQRNDVSEGEFDEKLRQYALEQAGVQDPLQYNSSDANGPLSKPNSGPKLTETSKNLMRETRRSSLEGDLFSQASRTRTKSGWLSRRLSGTKDTSTTKDAAPGSGNWEAAGRASGSEPFRTARGGSLARPATVPPDHRSPHDNHNNHNNNNNNNNNKSFAWEADADFTADDLQVSNSPAVAIGRSNTKIDEIRALEAQVNKRFPESPDLRPPRNSRLDEIRALEIEAALRFPDPLSGLGEESDDIQARKTKYENRLLRAQHVRHTSTKVDDIRVCEIESLSQRALATTRLDENQEQVAIHPSQPASTEVVRSSNRELLRNSDLVGGSKVRGHETEKTSVPMLGIPAFNHGILHNNDLEDEGHENKGGDQAGICGTSHRSDASRDLLRRLARATKAGRQKRTDGAKGDVRLTVGFAGLRRDSSVDSSSEKQSFLANSDVDPTERIQGEMNLFAPLENQSERGSLRAPSPSPTPEEDAQNKTPRPPKPDPLAQPTPRVTGAYVETPVTIKVEKSELASVVAPETATSSKDCTADISSTTSVLRDRKTDGPAQNPLDRMPSRKGERPSGRSSSSGPIPRRRRATSLPRERLPLLNSARPPTVKDDIREIQQAHQFEDSTLDDLADLLDAQDKEEITFSHVNNIKAERGANGLSDRERELDAYARMSKSLTTGLLGIRTAKKGIERLEDKFSHNHDERTSVLTCPICRAQPRSQDAAVAYLHLPTPRLWHRHPNFRFTFFGFCLFLATFWYVAESSMCLLYCKPDYCYPGKSCDWSPDDPLWGYAIPVKLDQWTTGGQGRAFVHKVAPEVADWLADMLDMAFGTDITTVDTSYYTWNQKHQYRRRLLKKGLVKPFVERPEDKEKRDSWKAARLARDRAEAAKELGYNVGEDESMTRDEKI
ncbi:hypothetical protein B0T17DRAFT_588339 [Bombardia bombarda]|uniref:Uncharacterized protein n=1 Tax=Bombardia bombarda TaxID=252184 RepID=A0AA40C856_9PEZI|nr:hypothetical protein B0T17DRAFT_588339 [Bombardia bombarda]